MQDYSIQRCTKRCKRSNRPLKSGEAYYAVVELRNANTIRYDVASCEWKGPPEHAIAWWKARMPEVKAHKKTPTPTVVLVEYLGQFCDDPEQQTLAYLLGMLLVRRKVLEVSQESSVSTIEQLGTPSNEGLLLKSIDDGQEFRVYEPDESLPQAELERCQSALHELLVNQASPADEDFNDESVSTMEEDDAIAMLENMVEEASVDESNAIQRPDAEAA